MVFHYFAGALLEALGAIGITWCAWVCIKQLNWFPGRLQVIIAFGLTRIDESFWFGLLSFLKFLPAPLLVSYFWLKVALGLMCFFLHGKTLFTWCLKRKWLMFWMLCLLVNASLPTSSYDNFTAHFSIARLFVETGAYPIRPDYQYMDALPLAAHMWYLPGYAAGFEGAMNFISPIFSLAMLILIDRRWGNKCAFWSFVLLMSMPEFIRLSLDPMLDTPCFFYALLGLAVMKFKPDEKNQLFWSLFCMGVSWSFLVGIKQTLIVFPAIFAICALLAFFAKKINFGHLTTLALVAFACGSMWYLKNGVLHGNPFYPYLFAPEVMPLIPESFRPEGKSLQSLNPFSYLKIIFMDHHWNLSLGPWPLILLPVLLWVSRKNRSFQFCIWIIILGFGCTLIFSSFKNRYFLPYLLLLTPWMALLIGRQSVWTKNFLKLTAVFTFLTFVPYIVQPIYAIMKDMDRDSWYDSKFPDYAAFNKLNTLPEGRILFVATPIYWLERDHVFSVYSETHLDYTRIKNTDELKDKLKALDINFIALDHKVLNDMKDNPNPYYSARRYCAQRCLDLLLPLYQAEHSNILFKEDGLWVTTLKKN